MNEMNQHCVWLNHTDTCQNMQTDLCYTEHGRRVEGWPMGPTKWHKNSQKWPKSMFCHRKGANRQDKILCWIELGLKRVCKEEILYWSRGVKGAPMGINKLGQKWPKCKFHDVFFLQEVGAITLPPAIGYIMLADSLKCFYACL